MSAPWVIWVIFSITQWDLRLGKTGVDFQCGLLYYFQKKVMATPVCPLACTFHGGGVVLGSGLGGGHLSGLALRL